MARFLVRPRAARGVVLLMLTVAGVLSAAAPAVARGGVKPNAVGGLDCNGYSPIQKTIKTTGVCTDPRSIENGRGARFEDNEHYIGHDEPIVRFLSSKPGSGNDVTWVETLPRDPAARPTVRWPGHDVTHWAELSGAPWFSMALCNSRSYPLKPCTPLSDTNAAQGGFPGGGSSFLEVQFYPPGEGPFVDNISCDNTHWCASLHINDAECDQHFNCNPNCVEPTNFAFIQTNGVPTGPPSPQLMTLQSNTPNSHTLLMNPGDRLRVHIFDAPVPDSGARALKVRVDDLTTGRSGFMQASARNGYMATRYTDCSGVPFNYRPEYSTAKPQNSVPWAALEVNIATEYEIGHFTPCTKLYFPTLLQLSATVSDTMWQVCQGAYERTNVGDEGVEETDAPCYPRGDTHGGLAPPNIVTGCVSFFGAGDVDFDGTSYWPDWPDSLTPNRHPSPFLQQQPTSRGSTYPLRQFQTDAAASEVTCQTNGQGCSVPPPAPLGPGHFYPYWTQARVNGTCVWEFGRMRNGNTFGGARQYGHPALGWYFGNLEGPITRNTNCAG